MYILNTRDKSNPLPLPPGSFGWPIIGQTYKLIMNPNLFAEQTKSIVSTHLLGSRLIMIKGAKNMGHIFTKESKNLKGYWPETIKILIGKALINLHEPEHLGRKKLLYKAFSSAALARYLPVICEKIEVQIKAWKEAKDITFFKEVTDFFTKLGMNVLVGLDDTMCDMNVLKHALREFVGGLFSLPYNIPGTKFAKALRYKKTLHEFIEPLVQEKLEEDLSDPKTALEFIISGDRDKLSLQEVIDEAILLLFTGTDTTASMITSLVLKLGTREDVVEKIREELQHSELLDDDHLVDEALTLGKLSSLPYLNGVIKEALRLFPSVYGGFRKVSKTFQLEGYQIPKDWVVHYGIASTQFTSDYFDNVDEFQPERWINFTADKSSIFNYLPFSTGSRACVGKEFALLVMRVFLVYWVSSCSWKLHNPHPKLYWNPGLQPDDGLPITIMEP